MTTTPQQTRQPMLDPEFERSARTQLENLEAELEVKESQRQAISREIHELRRTINGLRTALGQDDLPPAEFESEYLPPEAQSTRPDERTEIILHHAQEVLEEASPKDVHYTTIVDEVRKRGGNLPSNQKSAYDTLIRMMNQDSMGRFKRPKRRGYYALAADHPGAGNIGARRQS